MVLFRRSLLLSLLFSAAVASAQDSVPTVAIDYATDTTRDIQTVTAEGESTTLMSDVAFNQSLVVSPDGTLFMSSQSYGGDDEFFYGAFFGRWDLLPIDIQDVLSGSVFRDDSQGLAFTWVNGFDSKWKLDFLGFMDDVPTPRFRGTVESFDEIAEVPPFTFYGAPRVVRWIGDRIFIVPSGQNWSRRGELFVVNLNDVKSPPILREVTSVLQPLYEQYPQYFFEGRRPESEKTVPIIEYNWDLSPNGQFLAVPYVDANLCDPSCLEGWTNAVVVFDLDTNTVVTSFPTESEGPVMNLQWSEDGQQIAHLTGAQMMNGADFPPQLRIFDVRTGEQGAPIALLDESDAGLWVLDQALCGSTYFYALGNGEGSMRLYSISLNESTPHDPIIEGMAISILTCVTPPEQVTIPYP